MDSRLVAAAVIHEGLQDDFIFYTKGKHPLPDVNVASDLRRRFGLRNARNVHPASEADDPPFLRLRKTVGTVNGLLSSYFGSSTQPRPLDVLVLGGGSGEMLREFFSSSPEERWRWLTRRSPLSKQIAGVKYRAAFLTKETRLNFVDGLEDFADNSIRAGIRAEHLGDLIYLSSRAKYHFGVWWANSAVARFHPLYSPAGILAAHAMPNEDKAANRLGFELMTRFCDEIARVPFAEKRWSRRLMPDAPEPVTVATPYLGLRDEPMTQVYGSTGAYSRGERLPTIWKAFHEAKPDWDAFAPTFDVAEVSRFLSQPPEALTGKYEVDNAYRLMGAYVWARHLEIEPSQMRRDVRWR